MDARSISYTEGHGTGTHLGDPIEVDGLTRAFRDHTADVGFCALGSVKANIGHLIAAAGVAGLTKLLLQFRNHTLVPSPHGEALNPLIDFGQTPFVVQERCEPWERPGRGTPGEIPLRAGISFLWCRRLQRPPDPGGSTAAESQCRHADGTWRGCPFGT